MYNPNKKLQIEIEANDMSGANGYTVWHIVNGERKRTMSRKADGKDFDWMTERQMNLFINGISKFTITAAMAGEYFQYSY